ncbi:MAG: sigma-70 family RNA polymerase sigma factor [Deltaproteobacteria bacterium]|nr:sigma-70 family RNA polymerase sigma factor [Deltaproteobacteria bacterium]
MNVAVREDSAEVGRIDADWVSRCKAGDKLAWRQLYDQHAPLVYRLGRRMGLTEEKTADVCQEVFLRVYRNLGHFRGDSQFSTWLYRITINEVSRAHREGSVRRALDAMLGRQWQPADADPGPERRAQASEAAVVLEEILGRMKPKKRSVFVLFELEELSTEEIADVLGCGVETVKSRLRHARAEFDRLHKQRALVVMQGGKR